MGKVFWGAFWAPSGASRELKVSLPYLQIAGTKSACFALAGVPTGIPTWLRSVTAVAASSNAVCLRCGLPKGPKSKCEFCAVKKRRLIGRSRGWEQTQYIASIYLLLFFTKQSNPTLSMEASPHQEDVLPRFLSFETCLGSIWHMSLYAVRSGVLCILIGLENKFETKSTNIRFEYCTKEQLMMSVSFCVASNFTFVVAY